MRPRKILLSALTVALLSAFAAVPALAASKQKIGSVRLNAKNRIETGGSITRDGVVQGDPAKGELGVWVNADSYQLESVRVTGGVGDNLPVGSVISVEAVLRTTDSDRSFSQTLSESDVHLSDNAVKVTELRRSKTRLIVGLRFPGIKGDFAEPEGVSWQRGALGQASWREPANTSGSYELVLRRGGDIVKRVFGVTGNSYNFYPYMTKSGNYSFRIRTEAKGSGKSSGFTESETQKVNAAQVSNGQGAVWDQTGKGDGSNIEKAGWIQSGGAWMYRFPDGSFKKDGFEKIEGKWYFFSSEGKMRTGWARAVSGWYYFAESGEMLSGWQDVNGKMYYLDADPDSPTYGKVAANELIVDGNKYYYALADGQRAKGWVQLGDHWSYFYPESGEMARNTTVDTFYVDADGAWRH